MTTDHTISRIPLFGGLTDDQQLKLGDVAVSLPVKKGKLIFSEGDEGKGFYIVTEGQVKIFKLSPEGKEQILHILGPFEPFAEVALFAGANYPANAEVMKDGRLLFIQRERFMELIRKSPALALNMLGSMAMRLKKFSLMIEALSLKEVPGRLAEHILQLSSQSGDADEIRLEIPKTQLANLLGTIPETLSRILQKISLQGVIKTNGPVITILDREGLEALASGETRLSGKN